MALLSLARDLTALGHDQKTLQTFLENVVTKVNALDASLDSLLTGTGMLSASRIVADGAAVDSGPFLYIINGAIHSHPGLADQALGDTDTTGNTEFAGYAFDIGADGVVDSIAAADNAGGDYASAAAALAALPAVAANHVRIATLTVEAVTGTFVAATDDIDDANTDAIFTETAVSYAAVSETDDLTLSRA